MAANCMSSINGPHYAMRQKVAGISMPPKLQLVLHLLCFVFLPKPSSTGSSIPTDLAKPVSFGCGFTK